MTQRVYVVTEGEQHHTPWIVHAVFSDKELATTYADDLIKANGGIRWPNCNVIEFEINRVGHIAQEEAEADTPRDIDQEARAFVANVKLGRVVWDK